MKTLLLSAAACLIAAAPASAQSPTGPADPFYGDFGADPFGADVPSPTRPIPDFTPPAGFDSGDFRFDRPLDDRPTGGSDEIGDSLRDARRDLDPGDRGLRRDESGRGRSGGRRGRDGVDRAIGEGRGPCGAGGRQGGAPEVLCNRPSGDEFRPADEFAPEAGLSSARPRRARGDDDRSVDFARNSFGNRSR